MTPAVSITVWWTLVSCGYVFYSLFDEVVSFKPCPDGPKNHYLRAGPLLNRSLHNKFKIAQPVACISESYKDRSK